MGLNTPYKDALQTQLRKDWATQDQLATLRSGSSGSGRPVGCFPATALIATPMGPRPICAIEPGDLVLSVDGQSGRSHARRVMARKDYGAGRLWEITVERQARPVAVTGRHMFLTRERGWIRASRLRAGDKLVGSGNDVACVLDVRMTSSYAPVFNLITEGEHTFLAEGFVVHNFAYFRALRTCVHQFVEGMRAMAASRPSPPVVQIGR